MSTSRLVLPIAADTPVRDLSKIVDILATVGLFVFNTYADLVAYKETFFSGATVTVIADETNGGKQAYYSVVENELVLRAVVNNSGAGAQNIAAGENIVITDLNGTLIISSTASGGGGSSDGVPLDAEYIISFYISGNPDPMESLWHKTTDPVVLSAESSEVVAYAATAPTTSFVATISVGSGQVGSILFSAGQNYATGSITTNTVIDQMPLQLQFPSNVDGTIANINITIKGFSSSGLSGTVNVPVDAIVGADSVGLSGVDVFAGESNDRLRIRKITGGDGITVSVDSDSVVIDGVVSQSIGSTGTDIFTGSIGNIDRFRRISAGSNVSIAVVDETIEISATGGGGSGGGGGGSTPDTFLPITSFDVEFGYNAPFTANSELAKLTYTLDLTSGSKFLINNTTTDPNLNTVVSDVFLEFDLGDLSSTVAQPDSVYDFEVVMAFNRVPADTNLQVYYPRLIADVYSNSTLNRIPFVVEFNDFNGNFTTYVHLKGSVVVRSVTNFAGGFVRLPQVQYDTIKEYSFERVDAFADIGGFESAVQSPTPTVRSRMVKSYSEPVNRSSFSDIKIPNIDSINGGGFSAVEAETQYSILKNGASSFHSFNSMNNFMLGARAIMQQVFRNEGLSHENTTNAEMGICTVLNIENDSYGGIVSTNSNIDIYRAYFAFNENGSTPYEPRFDLIASVPKTESGGGGGSSGSSHAYAIPTYTSATEIIPGDLIEVEVQIDPSVGSNWLIFDGDIPGNILLAGQRIQYLVKFAPSAAGVFNQNIIVARPSGYTLHRYIDNTRNTGFSNLEDIEPVVTSSNFGSFVFETNVYAVDQGGESPVATSSNYVRALLVDSGSGVLRKSFVHAPQTSIVVGPGYVYEDNLSDPDPLRSNIPYYIQVDLPYASLSGNNVVYYLPSTSVPQRANDDGIAYLNFTPLSTMIGDDFTLIIENIPSHPVKIVSITSNRNYQKQLGSTFFGLTDSGPTGFDLELMGNVGDNNILVLKAVKKNNNSVLLQNVKEYDPTGMIIQNVL